MEKLGAGAQKEGQGKTKNHLNALTEEDVHHPAGDGEEERGGEEGEEPAARVEVCVDCL